MSFRIIELDSLPIFNQLELEESLLRTSKDNWCLINFGSPPAIVLGISQEPNLVIDFERWTVNPIPIIRRYTGGGTVVIEPTTILVTLILNKDKVNVPLFPKDILNWTEKLYLNAFKTTHFALKENDYVISEKKCGGNAQYFSKDRFVHHTSFIFDYSEKHMNLLKIPPKMPDYRERREHRDFIVPLKHYFKCPKTLIKNISLTLKEKFEIIDESLELANHHLKLPHRKSTTFIRPLV